MGCNCGKPKCDGHCNASPAVLQINNPSECVLFHKVEIPASMGNFDVFGLDYYSTNTSSALNAEVYNSINFTQFSKTTSTWTS